MMGQRLKTRTMPGAITLFSLRHWHNTGPFTSHSTIKMLLLVKRKLKLSRKKSPNVSFHVLKLLIHMVEIGN